MVQPSFFDSELAGAQKSTGFFSNQFSKTELFSKILNPELIDTKFYSNNGRFKATRYIPTYIMPKSAYEQQKYLWQVMPPNILYYNQNWQVSVNLVVHSMGLYFKGKWNDRKLVKTDFAYEAVVWVKYQNDLNYQKVDSFSSQTFSQTKRIYTSKPLLAFESMFDELQKNLNMPQNIIEQSFQQFLNHWTLAEQLKIQAQTYKERLDVLANCYSTNYAWTELILDNLKHYNLDLSSYRKFYDVLKQKKLTSQQYHNIISANKYLLLVANLEDLNNIKQDIPCPRQVTYNSPAFNQQQLTALSSTAPLSLLQSVAGSGKSHTINGRIDYLKKAGIRPETITALSFTNAAANHLSEKNPDINSLTISKMVHEIYQSNWTHTLSNVYTVVNCLRIMNQGNSFIDDFVDLLLKLETNNQEAEFALLHFISLNYNDVLTALNHINQTTLELEEIFCYLNISNKSWIDPFLTQYLIVDEVQDTSIFQFNLLLHYATVRKLNIFFVGDASQTLYQFRDADPEALNALENSNFFNIFKLETNYRSRPEILLLANEMLKTVKANQFANLRLHAPNLDEYGQGKNYHLTSDTFKQNVRYICLGDDYVDANLLNLVITDHLKAYLSQKIDHGEQVAFLTYTQKHAQAIYEVLARVYPHSKIVKLLSPQTKLTNVISDFVNNHGNEMQFIPTQNLDKITIAMIKENALDKKTHPDISYDHLFNVLTKELTKFYPVQLHNYQNGQISHQALITSFTNFLLSFEIEYNKEQQNYFDNNALEETEEVKKANFVISTIHSTKGLEFDNCVLLLTNTTRLTQEERRLYYVAMTRAKNSEVLLEATKQPNAIFNEYCSAYNHLVNNRIK